MIVRLVWFAGVFCVFGWLGAHWDGYSGAVPSLDPATVLPFDPAAIITRPFQELVRVLRGG